MKYKHLIIIVIAAVLATTVIMPGSGSANGIEGKPQVDYSAIRSIQTHASAAEDIGDVDAFLRFSADDVAHTMPGEIPFVGRVAVRQFLEIAHNRFEFRTTYKSSTTTERDGLIVDDGMVTMAYRESGAEAFKTEEFPYQWAFQYDPVTQLLQTKYITLGTQTSPDSFFEPLLAPTGPFAVGTKAYLFQDDSRAEGLTPDPDDKRQVAAQIWFPAQPKESEVPQTMISSSVATAISTFLSMPQLSSMSLVRSNSSGSALPDRKEAPYPVLVYNHGYSGFSGVYQSVFEDLASHGYVVASIGHAYESALFVLPDGSARAFDSDGEAYAARLEEAGGTDSENAKDRILRATTLAAREDAFRELHRVSPLHQASTRLWTADTRFVLDKLEVLNRPGGWFEGCLDLDGVGVFGHSLGGAVAGQLAISESRVKAGINLDGFQFGDLLEHPLEVPFMFMSAQRPWAGETMCSNDIYYYDSKAPAYMILFRGFEHASFTDLPLFGGNLNTDNTGGHRIIALQRVYIRAFFDLHLKGVSTNLLANGANVHSEAIVSSR